MFTRFPIKAMDHNVVLLPFNFAPGAEVDDSFGPSTDGYGADGYFSGVALYRTGVGEYTIELPEKAQANATVIADVERVRGGSDKSVGNMRFVQVIAPVCSYVADDKDKNFPDHKVVNNGRQIHLRVVDYTGTVTYDLAEEERLVGVVIFRMSNAATHIVGVS